MRKIFLLLKSWYISHLLKLKFCSFFMQCDDIIRCPISLDAIDFFSFVNALKEIILCSLNEWLRITKVHEDYNILSKLLYLTILILSIITCHYMFINVAFIFHNFSRIFQKTNSKFLTNSYYTPYFTSAKY